MWGYCVRSRDVESVTIVTILCILSTKTIRSQDLRTSASSHCHYCSSSDESDDSQVSLDNWNYWFSVSSCLNSLPTCQEKEWLLFLRCRWLALLKTSMSGMNTLSDEQLLTKDQDKSWWLINGGSQTWHLSLPGSWGLYCRLAVKCRSCWQGWTFWKGLQLKTKKVLVQTTKPPSPTEVSKKIKRCLSSVWVQSLCI